jgi:septal ring factor EnvC (AmiA/AmiB activator)
MATSVDRQQPSMVAGSDQGAADEAEIANDPFLSKSTGSTHHRYSHFDTQLFSLGPAASPDQVKRALEAHLAETERRIQDASKLGTTLVQQRKELSDRLKEVENQQTDAEITPELRQKLEDLEKEYAEVGRESARAFLPKSRVSSSEMGPSSPFVGDSKVSTTKSEYRSFY